VKRQVGMVLVLGCVASWPVFGQQTGTERGVPITVVLYDRANVKPESLAAAKQVVIRIMNTAGIAVRCIDPLVQTELPPNGYVSVVIVPAAYSNADRNEAGFAAVTSGPYPRAYVFLDRVKTYSERVNSRYESTVGIVLGHVIVHELGHLLMPGKLHTLSGIMRANWDSTQWDEAAAGLLLFNDQEAEIMRNQMRGYCSAPCVREPC